VQAAFDATVQHIQRRFAAFFALDLDALSAPELKQALDRIGEL
jgi:arsenate reductase